MTTFEALPTPPDDELIVTPATLPLSELMKLTSLLATMSSELTCCTLYDSAFSGAFDTEGRNHDRVHIHRRLPERKGDVGAAAYGLCDRFVA